MRTTTTATKNVWLGGDYIGTNRPMVRATIQKLNLAVLSYGATSSKSLRQQYTSVPFGQINVPLELPNLKEVKWSRSVDGGVASMTMTLYNTEPLPVGEPPQNGDLDQPGFYSPLRGNTAHSARWSRTANGWQDWIVPDRIIRTYEGYGFDAGVAPEVDPNLYISGTWRIDEVNFTHDGLITISCRDIGSVLLDQILFPPVVPFVSYPLYFETFHAVNNPDIVTSTGGASSGWIQPTYETSSNVPYVGAGGSVYGHSGPDAFDTSDASYWLSIGNARPDAAYAFEFIQGKFASQSITGGVFKVWGGPYTCYVSVYAGGKWQGDQVVPYDPNNPASAPNGANIRYVSHFRVANEQSISFKLPKAIAAATKMRLTFTNLYNSGMGTYKYRAGVRSFKVGGGTAVVTKTVDGGTHVEPFTTPPGISDYCVDTETEIFTKRGWLHYDEVTEGDEALAIDPATGKSGWQVIESVFRRERQRTMLKMGSQQHSSLTTPDHRWLVHDHKGRLVWRTTETLVTGDSIPTTAVRGDIPMERKHDDDFVELVAWWWTEGSRHGVSGEIGQSARANPEKVERIRGCLTRLYGTAGKILKTPVGMGSVEKARAFIESGLSQSEAGRRLGVSQWTIADWQAKGWPHRGLWNEHERPSNGVVQFSLGAYIVRELDTAAPDKVPTMDFLTVLTQGQLDLYVETSIDADGWRRDQSAWLSQKDLRRVEAFEAACALAGRATMRTSHQVKRGYLMHTVCVSRFDRTWPVRSKDGGREEVEYDGIIWCPTLKHHNWLARRDGKVHFTGNTDIVKILLAWSGFYWPRDTINAFRTYSNGTKVITSAPSDDKALVKGRVWGDFEQTGTYPKVKLDVPVWDKKPVMDGINYVRDIVGFIFYIDESGAAVFRAPNIWSVGNLIGNGGPNSGHTSTVVEIDEATTLMALSATMSGRNIREKVFVANMSGQVAAMANGHNPYPSGLRRVGGWCVDTQTEIFTRRGWLRYDQVTEGDETLSIDMTTGESVWQAIREVAIFDPEPREMYQFESNNFSALATADHRWVVETLNSETKQRTLRWRTSETLGNMDRIPRALPRADAPIEAIYTDELVELAAWGYTEGSVRRSKYGDRLAISQSEVNPQQCERIRSLMEKLFGPAFTGRKIPNGAAGWRESSPRRGGEVTWSLSMAASVEVMNILGSSKAPSMEFLTSLTQRQLELFIDVSIMADGWERLTSKDATIPSRFFGQNVGPRLDAFEAACALAGIPTSRHVETDRTGHLGDQPHATVCLLQTDYHSPCARPNRAPTVVATNEVVWCPAMPEHHTWLARRGGSVYYTGNTDQNFATTKECQIMADLITLRQLFTYRTDKITIPGNPAIQVDDQVRIYERVSEEAFLHYVTGVSMNWSLETGKYTYELDTHWLGDTVFDNWTFNPVNLSAEAQAYLKSIGKIP